MPSEEEAEVPLPNLVDRMTGTVEHRRRSRPICFSLLIQPARA
jgi:hypothetical protein